MRNTVLAIAALCLTGLTVWFAIQKLDQINLQQSIPIVFSCPSSSQANYSSLANFPFSDSNFTTAIQGLARCKSIGRLQYLSLHLSNGYLTNINVLKDLFTKFNLRQLQLDLSNNNIDDAGIQSLQEILKNQTTLLVLNINLLNNKLSQVTGFKNAFSNTVLLQYLYLTFGGSSLQGLDGLKDSLSSLQSLRVFSLTCTQTKLTGFPDITNNYTNLIILQQIEFNFNNNNALSDLSNLQLPLQQIKSQLSNLTLNFKSCSISDTKPIWIGATQLNITGSVHLQLSYNKISQLTYIQTAFQSLKQIYNFKLDLSNNQIVIAGDLWQFLSSLKVQSKITLYLNNNAISSLSGVESIFKNSASLQQLTLNLTANQIQDVEPLGKSLVGLTSLSQFEVQLQQNQISESVIDFLEYVYYELGANSNPFCPAMVDVRNNSFQSDSDTQASLKSITKKFQEIVEQNQRCSKSRFWLYYQ